MAECRRRLLLPVESTRCDSNPAAARANQRDSSFIFANAMRRTLRRIRAANDRNERAPRRPGRHPTTLQSVVAFRRRQCFVRTRRPMRDTTRHDAPPANRARLAYDRGKLRDVARSAKIGGKKKIRREERGKCAVNFSREPRASQRRERARLPRDTPGTSPADLILLSRIGEREAPVHGFRHVV